MGVSKNSSCLKLLTFQHGHRTSYLLPFPSRCPHLEPIRKVNREFAPRCISVAARFLPPVADLPKCRIDQLVTSIYCHSDKS